MQRLPFVVSQSANHSGGGCNRERDHQDESCKSNRDVLSFHHVGPQAMKIEHAIKDQINAEVQATIKKGKQSQHTAEANQLLQTADFSQRRNTQRNRHKSQGPVPGSVLEKLSG